MFGVTCTCSWLELFVVIWSWVKNDAAPFLGVGGLVGGYELLTKQRPFDNMVLVKVTKDLAKFYCQ